MKEHLLDVFGENKIYKDTDIECKKIIYWRENDIWIII